MKLSTYNGFAYQADTIGIESAMALAYAMGVSAKVVACFVRLYGKGN